MAKSSTNAAATSTSTPAPVAPATPVAAFVVGAHSKRTASGAQRNREIGVRGVTVYLGETASGHCGNSTTMIDYILPSKQAQYRKLCAEQPSHAWMKGVSKDTFIILGTDSNGAPLWTPEEAATVRREFQKMLSEKCQITWTGRLTTSSAALPDSAKEHLALAVEKAVQFFAPTAENVAEGSEKVEVVAE